MSIRRITIGKKLGVGFGLALLIIVIIGIVAYRSMNMLIDSAYWTKHTHEVIGHIGQIISLLKDAETGQRGFIITGEEQYLDPFNIAVAAWSVEFEQVKELTKDNPNQQRRLDSVESLIHAKFDELNATIELRETEGFESSLEVVLSERGKKIMDDIRIIFDEMENEEIILLEKREKEEQKTVMTGRITIIVGTITAFILLGLASYFIGKNITRPIHIVASRIHEIAGSEGDLTVLIPSSSNDETGELAESFNKLQEGLSTIIKQIRDASTEIVATSAEILAASEQQAASAREQSSAVSETTSAAQELSKSAEQVGINTDKVTQASNHTLVGMAKLKNGLEKTGKIVTSLNEKSQKIGTITELIDDVADQTNLLAVNAAIEAARAGEQGKGFAVVADEIRKLADSTGKSTKDITSLIELIQHEMTNVIMSMEESNTSIDEEVLLAKEASEKSKEISMSANQQISGSKQIADAMSNINEAMKQVTQGAQQSQVAAKQLSRLGEELKNEIARFKIKND